MKNESRTRDKPSSDFSQIKKATLHLLNQVETIVGHKLSIGMIDRHPANRVNSVAPPTSLQTVMEAFPIRKRTEAAVRHMILQVETYWQLGSNGHTGEFLECIALLPKTRRVFFHLQSLLALFEPLTSPKTLNQQ